MASTLISNADLRNHVESGLPDDAFERVIDQMDALIVERHGAHTGPLTETVYPLSDRELSTYRQGVRSTGVGYLYGETSYAYNNYGVLYGNVSSHIRVSRPIDSITSITAYDSYRADATATVIPADEYRVEGRMLVRLMHRFAPRVVIVYEPVNNLASRQRILIQLVRAEIRWAPVLSEAVDGASVSYRAYDDNQRAILETLREGLV